MGLVHSRTGTQRDWYTIDGYRDWYTMGLVLSGPVQGLINNGPGTQQGWYTKGTMGLLHGGIVTHGETTSHLTIGSEWPPRPNTHEESEGQRERNKSTSRVQIIQFETVEATPSTFIPTLCQFLRSFGRN